jgi:t-SNARE complex subunit (syntaxin)
MEKLCQEIARSHEQRQVLLTTLQVESLRLRADTAQRLQGFRKQSAALRRELQAARKTWQKAAAALAKKRRHPKRGAE